MALKIDWFGLAEGAASDARGMLTLVGFAPLVQVHPELPSGTELTVVLVLHDDEDPEPTLTEGSAIGLNVRVLGPDGAAIVGMEQAAPLGPKRYDEVPGQLIMVLGARLQFTQYGRHVAEVTVRVPNKNRELTGTRELYVLPE